MASRRDFAKILLAGIPLSSVLAQVRPKTTKIDSMIHGVQIGVQSSSYSTLSLPDCISAMKTSGLGVCELWAPHVEPNFLRPRRDGQPANIPSGETPKPSVAIVMPKLPPNSGLLSRAGLRAWRLEVSLNDFRTVHGQFDDAGVGLCSYSFGFDDEFTDAEIDRGFEMGKALGVQTITASAMLDVAKRLVPFAEKHKMNVAFEFVKPESAASVLAMSKRFALTYDIGDASANGDDPVQFIDANHDRIFVLHLKDRLKNKGASVPWGDGDTPIKPVLQLLRDKSYRIPAVIANEYHSGNPVAGVQASFQYCRDSLG